MLQNNIIPLLLLGTGIALSSKSNTNSNTGGNGSNNNGGTGSGVIDPNSNQTTEQTNLEPTVRGVIGNVENVIINYQDWRRREWSNYYKDLLQAMSMADASALLWQKWTDSNNKFKNLITNKIGLIFILSTYKDRSPAVANAIQWNSTPLYSNVYDYWMGEPYWSCQDWLDWHRALEQHYGNTAQANQTWLSAWNQPQNETTQSSWIVWGLSFTLPGQYLLAPPAFCPDDCDFIEYFHSKGMDVGTLFNNSTCSLQNVAIAVVDTVNAGANTVSFLASVFPIALAIYGVSWAKKNL